MLEKKVKEVNITDADEEHVVYATAILGLVALKNGPIVVPFGELDQFLATNPNIMIRSNPLGVVVSCEPGPGVKKAEA